MHQEAHRTGSLRHRPGEETQPGVHPVQFDVLAPALGIFRQGLEGIDVPGLPGSLRQQQRNVADVGAHIVDDRAGPDQLAQRGLQLRLVSAEPVILVNLHVEQDGEPGQVTAGHLDLCQPGRGGAVQSAADETGQRLESVDGLFERGWEDFGSEGQSSVCRKDRFSISTRC